MTTLRDLPAQVRWLLTHDEFRQHPIAVTWRVAVWELRRFKEQESVVSVSGNRLKARHFDGYGRLLFYFGEAADDVLPFLQRVLKRGMVFVDVGANIGAHTLAAARLVGTSGKVFSIEPDPDTAALLRSNVEANGANNVTIFTYAAAERETHLSFYVTEDSAKRSLCSSGAGTIQVQARRLDRMLPTGISVDVLKIDVEGAEPQVLEGAAGLFAEDPPALVVVETLANAALVHAYLEAQGYLLRAFDKAHGHLVPLSGPVMNTFAVHREKIGAAASLLP